MRVWYWGEEITVEQAQELEDTGRARVGTGTVDYMVMEAGPSNGWLEKQPPEVFLLHVFGHTTTWAEMARKWAETDVHMTPVAGALELLNHHLLRTRSLKLQKEADEQ